MALSTDPTSVRDSDPRHGYHAERGQHQQSVNELETRRVIGIQENPKSPDQPKPDRPNTEHHQAQLAWPAAYQPRGARQAEEDEHANSTHPPTGRPTIQFVVIEYVARPRDPYRQRPHH